VPRTPATSSPKLNRQPARLATRKAEEHTTSLSEAETESGQIIDEARSRAQEEAENIIARAGEKAKSILEEAEKRAADSGNLVSEAEQTASTITEEARKKAEDEANTIIAEAEQKAGQIIEEATRKAGDSTQSLPEPGLAARQTIQDAKKTVEGKAQTLRRETMRLLATASKKKIPEGDVRTLLDKTHQDLLSLAESLAKESDSVTTEISQTSSPVEPGPVPHEHGAAASEEASGQPASCHKEDDLGLFSGTVELALPPPITLEQMLRIHKHLKETPELEVLNLGGSVDKGITIRVVLHGPTQLGSLIGAIPGVADLTEELPGSESAVPGRQGPEAHPVRRVIVTTTS